MHVMNKFETPVQHLKKLVYYYIFMHERARIKNQKHKRKLNCFFGIVEQNYISLKRN